jgi:hypothetical protein
LSRFATSAVLLSLSAILSTTARSEWYVGGYGGLSYPGAFSNVTLSDRSLAAGVSGARFNDLQTPDCSSSRVKSSLVGGVKLGYFFESRPWLRLEADVFTLKPDVKQQVVVGGIAGT